VPAEHPSCTRHTGRCGGDPAECLNACLRARVWLCVQAAAACCMGRSRRAAPPTGRPACQGWGCGATAHKAHAATGDAVMLSSRAGLGEDWGTAELAAALYTFSTDVTRIKPLLPELSPADRCTPLRAARVAAAPPGPHGLGVRAAVLVVCRAAGAVPTCTLLIVEGRVAEGSDDWCHDANAAAHDAAGLVVECAQPPTWGPGSRHWLQGWTPNPSLPCAGARRWWRAWCGTTWAPASARWSAACWTRWAARRSNCATAPARARPAAARPAGTRCCRCCGTDRVGESHGSPWGGAARRWHTWPGRAWWMHWVQDVQGIFGRAESAQRRSEPGRALGARAV
jgi:hypothetical protein